VPTETIELAPLSVVDERTVNPVGVVYVVPVAVAFQAATITIRSPLATPEPIGTASDVTWALLDTDPVPFGLRRFGTYGI